MSAGATPAKRVAHAGLLALAAWIVAWHAWLLPPAQVPAWLAIALHLAVLVPGLALLAVRHRHAAFFGALGALVLFCHGIAEAWSAPAARVHGLVEALLAVAVIVGASLDGLRARFARKRGV